MMRAVRVFEKGGPEVLRVVEDVVLPHVLPNTVLFQVKAVGVNPVETYIRAGQYARLPAYPYTPGTDAAGVVKRVGEGVRHVSAGDRVYCTKTRTGAYAQYVLAEAEHVRRIPSPLSFAQAAALPIPYYTAHRALFHAGAARAGQSVLVHGATGGVGVAAIQLARAAGLCVIGTASGEAGEAAIRPWCHHVLRHGAGAGVVEAVAALTAPGGAVWAAKSAQGGAGGGGDAPTPGVDLIIEMRGDLNLGVDVRMVAQGGRVVVVGSRGECTVNPRDVMTRECVVTGVMLWAASDAEWRDAQACIHDGCEAGTLSPVVGVAFPGLEGSAEAHVEVMSHERTGGSAGKVVLTLP